MDSLRRHDPDQVPRVCGSTPHSQRLAALPCPSSVVPRLYTLTARRGVAGWARTRVANDRSLDRHVDLTANRSNDIENRLNEVDDCGVLLEGTGPAWSAARRPARKIGSWRCIQAVFCVE
jgi:hypothetical protein